LEGNNIARLDFVFPFLDSVEDIISGDLKIFDGATDLQFVHTEGNGDLLVFSSPDETVDFEGEDSLGEFIEILFLFEDLNFEDNDRSSNDFLLLLGGTFSSLLFLKFSELLGFFFIIIITEKIDVFTGSSGLFSLGTSFSPGLEDDGVENSEVLVPEEDVGGLFLGGGGLDGEEGSGISGVGEITTGDVVVGGEVLFELGKTGFSINSKAHEKICGDKYLKVY